MEKYTKIYEDIKKEKWDNYCVIISYSNGDDGEDPDVYLCDNENQGFIYLKNLIYNSYHNQIDIDFYKSMLIEYSSAENLNDLYEIYMSRNRDIKVVLIYCELNDEVELEKWIIDFDIVNTASKFNL